MDAIAAAALRQVQSLIGTFDYLVDRAIKPIPLGDAKTGGHRLRDQIGREVRYRFSELVRGSCGFACGVWQKHSKLFATDPSDCCLRDHSLD